MSACDTCRKPGACCRFFNLFQGRKLGTEGTQQANYTPLEMLAWLAAQGAPFMPLARQQDGGWVVWCPNLGRDGRCTDYENRPDTCRDYEPLADSLCAESPRHPACRWGFLER